MAHPQSEPLPAPKKTVNPPNRDEDRGFLEPKTDDSPREPEDQRISKD